MEKEESGLKIIARTLVFQHPASIEMKWIKETVESPEYTQVQSDGRIRKWRRVKEQGKFPRVILLQDGETVHNAFFDRSFKGELK